MLQLNRIDLVKYLIFLFEELKFKWEKGKEIYSKKKVHWPGALLADEASILELLSTISKTVRASLRETQSDLEFSVCFIFHVFVTRQQIQ